MMSSERQTYTKNSKQAAVRFYESSGKSAREIEQDTDITPGMLQKWRARRRQDGGQAFPGKGHQSEADAELRLKRELEITRQERDIIKSHRSVLARSALSYAFIADHAEAFTVRLQCQVLSVSESGYYAWRKRRPSERTVAEGSLVA